MTEQGKGSRPAPDLPDMVWLTEDFAAAPQPGVEHMAVLAQAGFRSVICNRPDDEVAPDDRAEAMAEAAAAAGLGFADIPVHHAPITPDMIAAERDALTGLPGPHFSYCRSGFRSSVLWALAQAGSKPTDEIVEALKRAGFAMPDLRAQIEALARKS